MKDRGINYYHFKRVEYILLFVIVFFSMSLSFAYFTNQAKDVASNSSLYLTYIGFAFVGYLILAIKNRKEYIALYYDKDFQATQSKRFKVIYQYLPIILFALMMIGQSPWDQVSYYVWFYGVLILMSVFFIIALMYISKAIQKIKEL